MTSAGRRHLAVGVLLALALPASASAELRGLWVVRTALVSPESVDRVVDDAAAAGLNALFVQVRGRGDAFYASRLVPRSVLLERQPRGFDPFARLMARARARGLQVHAWVNVLLVAHFGQPLPRGHVLERHPDWIMVPRSVAAEAFDASSRRRLQLVARAGRREADVEGYYLSPSVPEAIDHLEAVVRELVRSYPVDGLHLDFIRYPGPTWDHSRAALVAFRQVHGTQALLGGPALDPAGWDDYRRRTVTTLASRLADAARVERPGLVLSAAVAPDEAQAVYHKYQNWPYWLSSGILSALCPMVYTPDNRVFVSQVEGALARAGRQPVWAGIGAYRLDFRGIVEKVKLARRAGAGGVVLFSHESLSSADWRRLGQEAFRPPVRSAGSTDEAPGSPTPSR
ncbi:MAG: family 10 glycosylhydrolase [Acidobacteria bacterium]|nr:family 10 glycosylhydrolase [Acidobacteriota bacterium]